MRSQQSETRSQRTCGRCGEFITAQFARGFGNNDDEVNGCLSCRRARHLRESNHPQTGHKRATYPTTGVDVAARPP
ncbi:hypothetical protein SAMN04487950_4124 [Halogranum rubrum]|uniref:Uncharacterized protein n=1 Tax=Halogranum rubrum TaxID=553466 RepID=A0A1I4IHD5_9EURY|nr:hypothetical protein SAMN04487950_4124 [Halogranum rubrum]